MIKISLTTITCIFFSINFLLSNFHIHSASRSVSLNADTLQAELVYNLSGDPKEILRLANNSSTVRTTPKFATCIAIGYYNGTIDGTKNYAKAKEYLTQMNNPVEPEIIAHKHLLLGNIESFQERYFLAVSELKLFIQCIDNNLDLKNEFLGQIDQALLLIGEIYWKRLDSSACAIEFLNRARTSTNAQHKAEALYSLGRVHKKEKQFTLAVEFLNDFMKHLDQVSNEEVLKKFAEEKELAAVMLGQIYYDNIVDYVQAKRWMTFAVTSKNIRIKLDALYVLGSLCASKKNKETYNQGQAEAYFKEYTKIFQELPNKKRQNFDEFERVKWFLSPYRKMLPYLAVAGGVVVLAFLIRKLMWVAKPKLA